MAAVLIAGGVVSLAKASGGVPWGEVSKGTVSFYSKGQMKPEAIVRIGSARKTHQRRGFYRIGLLPALEVRAVTVEILRPDTVQITLARIDDHLRALGNGQRVELRGLRIVVSGNFVTEIASDGLVMDSDGIWKLKGRMTLSLEGQTSTLKSGQLTVVGDNAGKFAFENNLGSHVINLLSNNRSNLESHSGHSQ